MLIVKLEGVTRHGKNRVSEKGDWWEVVRDNDPFGQRVLLRSITTDDMRWVDLNNDNNFKVVGRLEHEGV